MVFQVLVNFNDKKNKPLVVAESEEEFNKTTVLQLKKIFKEKFPGAPGDPNGIQVIFGTEPLEDEKTLESYRIRHLSVLLLVLKMPGGGGPDPHDEGFPRSESMENIYYRTMNKPNP